MPGEELDAALHRAALRAVLAEEGIDVAAICAAVRADAGRFRVAGAAVFDAEDGDDLRQGGNGR